MAAMGCWFFLHHFWLYLRDFVAGGNIWTHPWFYRPASYMRVVLLGMLIMLLGGLAQLLGGAMPVTALVVIIRTAIELSVNKNGSVKPLLAWISS